MITTNYVPGSPCWLDLGAPDVAAAAEFYGAALDWQYQAMDDQYGLFKRDGKTVAALGPLTEKGARSAWMIYFATADVDATAQAVRQAGGTVRVAPMDIDSEARMAQFSDPQGGQFAAMQPGKTAGLEAVNTPGTLTWTELYTTDADAAKTFYDAVFGWQTSDMPMPTGGPYTLLTPAGGDEDLMQGGLMEMAREDLALTGGMAYWHPVFAVEDCDATVARFRDLGGGVQMGPEDAEGVGRLAICLDPAGADCVVLTPSAP
ncbi:VOC family protein [Streptomyces sp. 4N509B]|uniref:VOC family protein n=1 Tax=Streptomyces sp. 4N509B TaxID=3457413 RepID=UPI003FD21178